MPRRAATKLLAFFWFRLGHWFDAKNSETIADSCYRFAGDVGGRHGAAALLALGKKHLARNATDAAISVCRSAAEADPEWHVAWNALGVAFMHAAQLEDARRCFERALQIDPEERHALTNLGAWHLRKGNPSEALRHLDRVLAQHPAFTEALGNRVSALLASGKLNEAEQAARRALEIHPGSAELHILLAGILSATNSHREACILLQRALDLEPENEDARFSLAALKGDMHVLSASVEFIRRKIKTQGETPFLQHCLALALGHCQNIAESEAICRKLLEANPKFLAARNTLAGNVSACGDITEAITLIRTCMELQPTVDFIFSNYLFFSDHLQGLPPEELFRRHTEWAERFEAPLLATQIERAKPAAPRQRLKIGYVSGDLGRHPVGYLLLGVFEQHNHAEFEIHVFATSPLSDDMTAAFRQMSDRWHDVQSISTDEIAKLVRETEIDILVDLAGHTGFGKLMVFAMKPAPVQVSWVGYFHSTGLKSIDYFITDPYTTPPEFERYFSEVPVRMPHTRFCYTPPLYAPAVSGAPSEQSGTVTFGSFNRMQKLGDAVVEAWSEIVRRLPNCRLLLKSRELADEETARRIRAKFERHGVAPERLILRPGSDHARMLQEYSEVDISLDPFPFNGGATSLDSLWMGVPVVTLAGETVPSRQSLAILANLGLQELAFGDVESYIVGAVCLASDVPRLARLRSEIRRRMRRSALCDAEQFTRDLEHLYQRMWQAWCRGEKLASEAVASPPVTRKKLLHVGCGPAEARSLPSYFRKGWTEVRVDIDPATGPDVVASVLDMSAVPSSSCDGVFSSHMLEHLHAHELPVALGELKRVLKPDGFMLATVPDLQAVARLIAEDRLMDTAYESPAGPIAAFDMVYGHRGAVANGQTYMAHRGGFTLSALADAVRAAGFAMVTGKRRESLFDLWIVALPTAASEARLAELSAALLPE